VEKVNLVIEKSIKAAIAKTLESGVGWEEIIIIDKDVKTLCEKVGFLKKKYYFFGTFDESGWKNDRIGNSSCK
jgi:hypothetical protein